MSPTCRVLLLVACAALAASCSSTRRLRYDPVPAHVQVELPTRDEQAASVYASVVEARREGETWAIHVRVRVDNRGPVPLAIVRDELRLLDGDLLELGSPRATPPLPDALPSGGTWAGDLDFPLPAGRTPSSINLDGLHLHLALDDGAGSVPVAVAFQRRARPPSDLYAPGYPFGFHGHRFFRFPYGFYSYGPTRYWQYY